MAEAGGEEAEEVKVQLGMFITAPYTHSSLLPPHFKNANIHDRAFLQ